MADDIKTKRITEYEETTSFVTGDWIFVDNTDTGTRKISAETIKTSLSTDAQIAAIQAKGAETLASIPESYADVSNDVNNLKSALLKSTGNVHIPYNVGYIATNGTSVNYSQIVADQTWRHAVVDCNEGDIFTVNASGGGIPRAWCWIDSNNNVISASLSSTTVNDYIMTAPQNAAKLIINTNNPSKLSYYGEYLKNIVGTIEDKSNEFINNESNRTSSLIINTYNENLISGSDTWFGDFITSRTLVNNWEQDGTYMGLSVMSRTGTYDGLYKRVLIEANKQYTFDAFVKSAVAQDISVVIGNAASNDGTTAIISVGSNNVYVSANEWTLVSVTFNCSGSGLIAPRIESRENTKISVCGYVLYEGKQKIRVKEIVDNYESILETTINFNSMVDSHINLLDDNVIVTGELYGRGTVTPAENENANRISSLINIKAGETYYYKNIWAYFSAVKYSDGTTASLSDDTATKLSGYFTATKNGAIAITLAPDRNHGNILLTTSEELYNSGLFPTLYIPKKLDVPKIYHVEKDGSGDFTKLVDAIEEAEKYMDSIVYVGSGTWDVIDEIGASAFENISQYNRGIYLKNRIHLIFSSNSKWVCNYTGNTESVINWACVFNSGEYGFTLENATLEGSNIRYLVHDERNSESDTYINKYINCHFMLDNSQSTSTTNQCIGGGLGLCGYVEIDGCYFNTTTATAESPKNAMFYHNSESSGSAKSHISVKNCYVEGYGRMGFHWLGNSQLITDIEVSNCSYGAALDVRAETASAQYENIRVLEWNNIVRTD